MIVTFLMLYNYGASLLKEIGFNKFFVNDEWAFLIFDVPTLDTKSYYTETNELKFIPPLYFQRYEIVKEILKNKSAGGTLKVVDFGCSEIAFFQVIKHMKGVREYLAVDIDKEILNRFSCRVQPLTFDYLKKRAEPLIVQVLCGSVSQPDLRLQNSNAVVAIELIEHLHPDVLEELPYNIFGRIQPEIAVFTTPNSEYNILFPHFTGFRHDDHKFEWTREQFESWANNLILRFPNYKVVFGGVGPSPDCGRDFGYCTQIAVFFRNVIKYDTSSQFYDVYKVIKKVEYPFYTEAEKLKEIIQNETEKFIKYYSKLDCYQTNERIEIPLKDIHNFLRKECSCTEEDLGQILASCGWNVSVLKNGPRILVLSPLGEEDLDNSFKSSLSSSEDHDLPYPSQLTEEEEDWDTPTFVNAMDPVTNRIEEATSVGGGSSSGEIEQQETVTQNNGTSFNTSFHSESNNIDSVNSRSLLQFEEARSSSSSSKNGRSFSHLKQNSCCSSAVKNEKSEVSGPFLRSPLQKCHSLENVNKDRSKNNPCRFSLNIDKYKFSNCDIGCSESSNLEKVSSTLSDSDHFVPRQEDSCSQSKAADSGYPNSYGQDMDMDLTPEQVDEIITESESSFDGDVEDESGGEEEEPLEIRGEIVRLGENVENGDVANNNRDGEGNNMEAIAAGGILQFEQVIAEEEIAVGNLAAAVRPDMEENLELPSLENRIHGSEGDAEELLSNPVQVAEYFAPENNIIFPDWLLHIFEDDLHSNDSEVNGAGDGFISEEPELEVSEHDAESVSENERASDIELFEESSVELTVQGDLMGGGEPPPIE